MSDAALIEAYLAKGGAVTHCPTGKSALALEYEWVDGKGLVAKDREKAKKAFRHSVGSCFVSAKSNSPTPEQIKRRETVAALIDAGHSGLAISRMLTIDPQTVYKDAQIMGRKFPKPIPPRQPLQPHVTERRRKVRALIEAGEMTAGQIAVEVDAAESTIYTDARIMGLSLKKARAKAAKKARKPTGKPSRNPSGLPMAIIAERRKQLPALIARGMSSSQLARKFNTTARAIRHDCRILGISSPGKVRQQMKEAA
ncbi:hypothetical protein [Limimaricola cinnabarinus]|uniref:hypothetical protein n=1 Tax=Limimaricola cinnabarinus TaxID=1125964 RepID=UPI00249022F3|nr:hypothetical protein [Limimaricola cinnabarinus]